MKLSTRYASWSKIFGDRQLEGDVEIPDTVKPIYKNGVSDWSGMQPDEPKPILYVSSIAGSKSWDDRAFTKLTGIKHRCFSYAYCGTTSPMVHNKHVRGLDDVLKRNLHVFMDSGAHSLHKMLRSGTTLAGRAKVRKDERKAFVGYITDEFILRYAEYVRWSYATKKKFDFTVTLDAEKTCSVIYKITKRLGKLIGVEPTPVFHGDDSLEWVRRYAGDGHKFLGIGISTKRIHGNEARHRYYSSLFELMTKLGMQGHGFAVTGHLMFRFPFFSIDSATHIKVASFGKLLVTMPEKQRVAQVHISPNYSSFTSYGNIAAFSKDVDKHLRNVVECNGFDLDVLAKDLDQRIIYNALILKQAIQANHKKAVYKEWGPLI